MFDINMSNPRIWFTPTQSALIKFGETSETAVRTFYTTVEARSQRTLAPFAGPVSESMPSETLCYDVTKV